MYVFCIVFLLLLCICFFSAAARKYVFLSSTYRLCLSIVNIIGLVEAVFTSRGQMLWCGIICIYPAEGEASVWSIAPSVSRSVFTFKTLLRHYAKWELTPRSLNVKLGPRRNYHKGRAAIRHYANQTARPL